MADALPPRVCGRQLLVAVILVSGEDAGGAGAAAQTRRPACNLMGKQLVAAGWRLHRILITSSDREHLWTNAADKACQAR